VEDDPELAALLDTVRLLRRTASAPTRTAPATTPEADFPLRLAAQLERELRRDPMIGTTRQERISMATLPGSSSNGTLRPPTDADNISISIDSRRATKRQWLQFAAAVVAFAAVAAVLVAVMRGGGEREPQHAAGGTAEVTATTGGVVPDATATPDATEPATSGTTTVPPTPTEEPGSTPDTSGATWVTTFDEARTIAAFDVVEPTSLPEGVALNDIAAAPERVDAFFTIGSTSSVVEFLQTIASCADPSTDGERADIDLGGKTVRRTVRATGDIANMEYRWQAGGICYVVLGETVGGSQETVEALVAAIPLPQAGAQPTPTPQPAEPANPAHPTLTLSPIYGDCDDTVTATGRNFEPNSTIAIYGAGLLSDNPSAVVDAWTVGDDGSFAVEIDLARLINECGGGDPEREGNQYRLTASDMILSNESKADDTEGEVFAHAVFTFMHGVPDVVLEREALPTCGTEIQRLESPLGPGTGPDPVLRQCFADAVTNGQLAELIVHQPTIEGDYIALIYRSVGNGQVVIISDSTRDRFGSGQFTIMTCSGLTLEPTLYEFQWNACDGGAVLE
jgi:hypothetical protein